jgi:Transposase and inactivated derivatives
MSTKQNKTTPNRSKLTNLQYRRIQGGRLIEQGYDNHEIVDILGCGLSTVQLWRKIVREQGLEALAPQPRPGRTPKLNVKQLDQLQHLLKQGAMKFGYANAIWTSRRVRQLIQDQFGVAYSKAQTCRLLRKIGYSPKKPVTRSKKYLAQAVETWRRHQWPLIKKIA